MPATSRWHDDPMQDDTIKLRQPEDDTDALKAYLKPIATAFGDTYDDAEVVKLADFGAFVNLKKGVDGLLHVSRILPRGNRLASAEQVLSRGDHVRVTVVEVDKDRGRVGLTLLAKLNDAGGETTPEQLVAVAEANPAPERSESDRPRGGGGGRDRGRGPRRDR